jgi:hypothetical protein
MGRGETQPQTSSFGHQTACELLGLTGNGAAAGHRGLLLAELARASEKRAQVIARAPAPCPRASRNPSGTGDIAARFGRVPRGSVGQATMNGCTSGSELRRRPTRLARKGRPG